ncbi:putative ABC transport system permease protein [Planifilum fimeticola]|uniref:Putative ABC transport system permease protein n=1 Tax=Planifilum fimeticola TaxID=201975 RepID=A0A2T0LEU8_9BACL|nr:ABC transporter permease [Planifilum fimeticola]PRX40674.1 putative ABC transport system permease protein [Planifilum fimeticola]
MSVWESVKMAFDSIFAHKLRSFLTMLGIVIGVASVIIIVSIGQGGEAQLTEAFAGTGNTITVMPSSEMQLNEGGALPPDLFTEEDIRALEGLPEVKRVLALSYSTADIRYRGEQLEGAIVFGINNNGILEMDQRKLSEGSGFRTSDFLSGSAGALVSADIRDELFDGKNPVGSIIRIGDRPVVVKGVLEPVEGLFSGFQQTEIYLPYRTWQRVFGQGRISQLTLQAESPDQIQAAGEKAVDLLNRRHNTDDGYQVLNLEQITEGISRVARIMTIVIGSIGGISLLVGGIGVMNIMLVSVTERTREIGIRMAVGATRTQILLQFLIESITLSVIGGAIGILIGYGVSALISLLSPWPATVSLPVALGGLLFSVLFGVVFGLLPANKAARLHPIECLRYE